MRADVLCSKMEEFRILIVQTGGTIDKDYPKRKGGYAFEICDSGARAVLNKVGPSFPYRLLTVCREDSQDLNDQHRSQIVTACKEAKENFILITHGTDTILQTAAYIAKHMFGQDVQTTPTFGQSHPLISKNSQSAETQLSPSSQLHSSVDRTDQSSTSEQISDKGERFQKILVLTGAFLPERFKETDADFNIGVVIGAMQGGLTPGVYVSLGGRVWPWNKVTRSESGQYVGLK